MNKLIDIEKEQIQEALKAKKIPAFKSGDTVKVNVYVTEGNKERIQAFEGVCIARSNRGFNSTFTVRKVSHGEGVERVFPLYSPMLESINLVRRGKVRRSKLYYLRQRSGKSARIAEKKDIIKKVNQTPSNKNASTKEANINSLENKDSTQKTKETSNQEVDKENKKEST
jgi:large subunit ribosomal protein L19